MVRKPPIAEENVRENTYKYQLITRETIVHKDFSKGFKNYEVI
jgi:hypothetical protein